MSTSSASEKSGAVAFDSAMRRVTVCCRRVSSWISDLALGAGLAAGGLGALRASGSRSSSALGRAAPAPPLSAAACTSAFTIRPPGPEPSSRASSTPSSRAIRRATGEAFTRSPSPAPLLGARAGRGARSARAAGLLGARGSRLGLGSSARRSGSSRRLLRSGSASASPRRLLARLARLADARDQLADGERVALLGHDLDQHAVGVGLVGHVGLVRLDLHERLAALDLAALLHEPLEDRALLHRVGQARHRDVGGHR